MKTTHKHTREWSRKGRKRDNRSLRGADKKADLAEQIADIPASPEEEVEKNLDPTSK